MAFGGRQGRGLFSEQLREAGREWMVLGFEEPNVAGGDSAEPCFLGGRRGRKKWAEQIAGFGGSAHGEKSFGATECDHGRGREGRVWPDGAMGGVQRGLGVAGGNIGQEKRRTEGGVGFGGDRVSGGEG